MNNRRTIRAAASQEQIEALEERVEALEKLVSALWYAPGNPGAMEAKELHESRIKSQQSDGLSENKE
jgi:hypothetical protein